jgi:hypothetical protein
MALHSPLGKWAQHYSFDCSHGVGLIAGPKVVQLVVGGRLAPVTWPSHRDAVESLQSLLKQALEIERTPREVK